MNYIPHTHPKFRQMMALFTQTGKIGYRHGYAWQASRERTESTKELTEAEVDLIIKALQNELFSKTDDNVADRMRKKIIAMAREMHWEQYDIGLRKVVADMQRINDWCVKYGKFKKKLNLHTKKELGVLVTQFESVYAHYLSLL